MTVRREREGKRNSSVVAFEIYMYCAIDLDCDRIGGRLSSYIFIVSRSSSAFHSGGAISPQQAITPTSFISPASPLLSTHFLSLCFLFRPEDYQSKRTWIYLAGVGGSNCDWIRATVQGDKKCSFPARWLCVRVWAHVWHSNLCGLISVLHTNGVYIQLGRCCTFKLS